MTGTNRLPQERQPASRPASRGFEEHGLSALLGVLLVYYLVFPLFLELGLGRLLTAACFTLFAGAGVLTVAKRPFLGLSVRIVAPVVLVAAWSEVAYPGPTTMLVSCIADVTLLALVLVAVGHQVFYPGPVTGHRIRGAVVIYLLLGAVFGLLYMLVVVAEPGAFRFASELDRTNAQAIRTELSYFSFVTLSTLGYGDIIPVSPMARSLATLEAISGQLFLAITLARLVSGEMARRVDSNG